VDRATPLRPIHATDGGNHRHSRPFTRCSRSTIVHCTASKRVCRSSADQQLAVHPKLRLDAIALKQALRQASAQGGGWGLRPGLFHECWSPSQLSLRKTRLLPGGQSTTFPST
jgi:hypothetical protein